MSSSATAVAESHDDHHEHPPPFHTSSKRSWAEIGIYTFIGSEIALFGAFFMAYFFIRVAGLVGFEPWQDAIKEALPTTIVLMNTAILLSSSLWIWMSERAYKAGNRRGAINWMIVTIIFGATFLGVQIYEYSSLVNHESIGPSTNAYSSVFFSITGLHGSHVAVGLVLLAMVLTRLIRNRYELGTHPTPGFMVPVIYWHFVDVVWIVVLTTLYLL